MSKSPEQIITEAYAAVKALREAVSDARGVLGDLVRERKALDAHIATTAQDVMENLWDTMMNSIQNGINNQLAASTESLSKLVVENEQELRRWWDQQFLHALAHIAPRHDVQHIAQDLTVDLAQYVANLTGLPVSPMPTADLRLQALEIYNPRKRK